MSDYRNFIRYSEDGFDGTIPETATYAQIKNVWTTTIDTEVGLFAPVDLGRINTPSIARVMLEGTINDELDRIEILDNTGALRFTAPASIVSSGFFFLYPQDSIAIFAAGARKADVLIEDLNEERLAWWIQTEATANITPPQPYSERTLTAAATLAAWKGRLVVFLEFAVDGDVVLPAPAGVALGDTVTFIRSSDDGIPRIVTAAGAALFKVNGIATAGIGDDIGLNSYTLRSRYESISYMRVTGGWQHDAGVGTPKLVVATANPTNLSALREGDLYVFDEIPADGAALQLPSVNLLGGAARGSGYSIFNRDTRLHYVLPSAGETINGAASFAVPAGAVVRVEAAGSANSEWLATSRVNVQNSATIAALPATIALTGGSQIVRVSAATGGDLTLPSLASTPLDTELVITLTSGAGRVRVIANNAADSINGTTGIVATQHFLQTPGDAVIYRRTSFGWTRTVAQALAPPPIVSAAAVVLSPFSGEQFVHTTGGAGQTVTLPDATLVAPGTRVAHYNSSGSVHTLAAFAGQTVLGAAFGTIPTNTGFVVYCDGTTDWKGWALP